METKEFKKMEIKTAAKAIFSFVLFFSSLFMSSAQEKIDTYSMSALRDREQLNFDIGLSDDNTLWIDVFSTYNPGVRCGFKLDENHKSNFISTVMEARNLYTVWKQMAIENNFQDIKKKMHFIFYTGGYFTYFDSLKHDENVQVIFAFTHYKDDYVLIMSLDNMTDKDNEHISFKGGSIIFNSEEEINSFLDKISTESICNLKASQSENADN